ncbi:MAG: hypothetical protein R6X23_14855 [Acidimicrobiia bacterium]
MRAANVIVSSLGIAATTTAATIAWRWRRTPLLDTTRPAAETSGRAALDGLRTLASVLAAGGIAGLLVVGIGGRLVMRILGATSGDAAQGLLTDADEVVGEITAGGTIGLVLFSGLFAGVITAFGYLAVRRWLPRTAGPAGVVVGILLLGTLGVGDALSPDNVDFAILRPTWLAVTLIAALAVLFGVTFTALAARLEAGMPTLSARPSSIAAHAGLIFVLLPPVALGAAAYVVGRAAIRGGVAPTLALPQVRRAGQVVIGVAVALTALNSARVIEEIVSA